MTLLRRAFTWAIVSASLLAPLSAGAQSAASASADDEWHFQFGLPLWMPSLSGDVSTPLFPDIPVDLPFSEVLDNLHFAIMAHAEARKGQMGFAADLLYVNVDASIPTDRRPPSLQAVKIGMKQTFVEGFGFYRVIQQESEQNGAFADLIVGARYYWTETSLDNRSDSFSWVDLMLGARGHIPLGTHFGFDLRGDMAFLGSSFTYNLLGDAAWRFSPHWAVSLGYRYMNIDKSSGDLGARLWNVSYHGPMLGVSFDF